MHYTIDYLDFKMHFTLEKKPLFSTGSPTAFSTLLYFAAKGHASNLMQNKSGGFPKSWVFKILIIRVLV